MVFYRLSMKERPRILLESKVLTGSSINSPEEKLIIGVRFGANKPRGIAKNSQIMESSHNCSISCSCFDSEDSNESTDCRSAGKTPLIVDNTSAFERKER